MHLLLVDDDESFTRTLAIGLEAAGIAATVANEGAQGLRILSEAPNGHFDLILLDVEMPVKDGWELLAELREKGDEIPVVFVTGRDSSTEKIRGLRLGADDWIVKPLEFDVLLARLEAVLRRRNSLPPLRLGDLELDLARRKAARGGKRLDLSPKEYDLLYVLARAAGTTKSREELLLEVWDIDFDPGTNVLDVHIGRLRRKLDRLGRPLIQTVRGEGYRIDRPVPSTNV